MRLRGGGSIGSGSGRRSLEARQARRLRSRRVCCRRLVSGGSARVAGCRLSISRRCPAYLSFTERERSRFLLAGGSGCDRSRVSSIVHRRRSPESCNATPRSDVAALSYRARPPQHAERRARRPKPAKLAVNAQLRAYVQDRLSGTVQGLMAGRWSGYRMAWARQGPRKDRRWGSAGARSRSLNGAPGLPR